MMVSVLASNRMTWVGYVMTACVLVGLCLPGCGQNNGQNSFADGSNAESTAGGSGTASMATLSSHNDTADSELTIAAATDVVSQFLDLVRRGGGDSGAAALLTQKAQNELNRIGRTVQPIGSPDARFVVTRAEAVPNKSDAALVHSVWSEPDGAESSEYQVVWALQNQSGQWRISGLAMEIDPEQSPLVVNFEDGNRMAALLAEVEPENNSSDSDDPNFDADATNASASGSSFSR